MLRDGFVCVTVLTSSPFPLPMSGAASGNSVGCAKPNGSECSVLPHRVRLAATAPGIRSTHSVCDVMHVTHACMRVVWCGVRRRVTSLVR